jgi:hypothetical protein
VAGQGTDGVDVQLIHDVHDPEVSDDRLALDRDRVATIFQVGDLVEQHGPGPGLGKLGDLDDE